MVEVDVLLELVLALEEEADVREYLLAYVGDERAALVDEFCARWGAEVGELSR